MTCRACKESRMFRRTAVRSSSESSIRYLFTIRQNFNSQIGVNIKNTAVTICNLTCQNISFLPSFSFVPLLNCTFISFLFLFVVTDGLLSLRFFLSTYIHFLLSQFLSYVLLSLLLSYLFCSSFIHCKQMPNADLPICVSKKSKSVCVLL